MDQRSTSQLVSIAERKIPVTNFSKLHQHKCRSCNEPYDCTNMDCRAGTVNFLDRRENCPKCSQGAGVLKTRLTVDGLTEIYCQECGAVGTPGRRLPACNGEHENLSSISEVG